MNSIENRLNRLEAAISVSQSHRTDPPHEISHESSETPLEQRLQKLCQTIPTKIPPNHCSDVQKNMNLLQSLAPSDMILNQPASTVAQDPAPVIYRKQEILARYEQFENALEQLARIRDLLAIMNPRFSKDIQKSESGEAGVQILMDHILSSPIISGPEFAFASDEANLQRLNTCIEETLEIHQRSLVLANRVDVIVERYSHAINVVNQKLLLLQEHRV